MLWSWVLGPRFPGAAVMGSVCPVGPCSPSALCRLWLSLTVLCHGKLGFLTGFEVPPCV